MKKLFTSLIILTSFSFLFAKDVAVEPTSYTDFYTTFGFFSDQFQEFIPSISIGKKAVSKNGNGIDYGATVGFLERKEVDGRYISKKKDYVVMFPRIEYIHYGSKDFENVNGYLGIGACTAFYRLEQGSYEGIVGNMTVGFDFYREKNMNGFIQAKSYYPLLSFKIHEEKKFPLILIDIGLGF